MTHSFCSPGELARRQTLARRESRILICLGALMAALLLTVCLTVRTGTARIMTWILLAGETLLGWGVLLFGCLRALPARARLRHLEGLAAEQPKTAEGVFFLHRESVQIPHSVRVYPVTLQTEQGPLRLNLDACRVSLAPADGTPVRAQTVHRFITSLDVPDHAVPAAPPPRHRIRRISALIPWMILWAFCAVLFGGFIMNRITDAPAEKKLTVYVDGDVRDATLLAEALENGLNGAVRMVKVHPFTYALFGSDALKSADLYLVPRSDAETYADWFAPLPDPWSDEPGVWTRADGTPTGIPLTAADGTPLLSRWLPEDGEPWLLCFGAKSLHLADLNGASDDAARDTARLLTRPEGP